MMLLSALSADPDSLHFIFVLAPGNPLGFKHNDLFFKCKDRLIFALDLFFLILYILAESLYFLFAAHILVDL